MCVICADERLCVSVGREWRIKASVSLTVLSAAPSAFI